MVPDRSPWDAVCFRACSCAASFPIRRLFPSRTGYIPPLYRSLTVPYMMTLHAHAHVSTLDNYAGFRIAQETCLWRLLLALLPLRRALPSACTRRLSRRPSFPRHFQGFAILLSKVLEISHGSVLCAAGLASRVLRARHLVGYFCRNRATRWCLPA